MATSLVISRIFIFRFRYESYADRFECSDRYTMKYFSWIITGVFVTFFLSLMVLLQAINEMSLSSIKMPPVLVL